MVRSFVRFSPGVRAQSHVLLASLLLAACGGDGSTTEPPMPGPVVSVAVSPSSPSLTYLDETVQLSATARDANGTVVPDASVSWMSSDPSVVTVSDAGLVTAVGGGMAEVTASAAGHTDIARVSVTGPSDLEFLRADWTGEAVAYTDAGTETLSVAGVGTSRVGGAATRLELVVGSGDDARTLVLLGHLDGSVRVLLGLADAYRGTFTMTEGVFDGLGGASFDSRQRLGNQRMERVRMGEFRETSLELLVDVSDDDGSTWSPVWAIHLEKTTNAPELPDMGSPECGATDYASFDFWQGDWNVTAGGGQAGTDLVEPLASMCGIQENWSAAGGGTGISLNMYDPRSGLWTQYWVDSSGLYLELTGGLQGDAMVLQGVRGGTGNVLDRVTWTPNVDGSVRQLWETNTGGTGWVTTFDGLYRPKG